jgi:predicted nucleic acid-binding protein
MKLINSARFTAVLDANVLFPVVVRDYLLWLSLYELYSPKWSTQLLDEFKAIFAKKKISLTKAQINQQVQLMNKACPSALVTNYHHLINNIKLKDENDRHVVAAAIKCNANVIVTYNLKDFPQQYLSEMGLNAIDPDTFIADMIDLAPTKCCEAFQKMVLTKNKPPYEEKEYLDILAHNNLKQTAEELRRYLEISNE